MTRWSGRTKLRSDGGPDLIGNGHSDHAAFERDRVTGCWLEDETALDLSTAPHGELQLRSRQSYGVNRPHGAGNEDVTVILDLYRRARWRPRLITARTQIQQIAEFSTCIFDDHACRSA
jgi:hypothetical protein